jgi:hypothetical protein
MHDSIKKNKKQSQFQSLFLKKLLCEALGISGDYKTIYPKEYI